MDLGSIPAQSTTEACSFQLELLMKHQKNFLQQ